MKPRAPILIPPAARPLSCSQVPPATSRALFWAFAVFRGSSWISPFAYFLLHLYFTRKQNSSQHIRACNLSTGAYIIYLPGCGGENKKFFILYPSILSAIWLKYPYIECWFSSRKFLKKYCENPCNTRICVVSLSGMIVGSGASMPETQSADMRWCRRWPSFETGNFCGVCPI